jgi:hypothetical protein
MLRIANLPQNFNDHRSRRRWGMPELSRKLNEMGERFRAAADFIEPCQQQNALAVQDLTRFFVGYRMRVGKTPAAAPVFSPAVLNPRIAEQCWRTRAGLAAGPPPPQKESPQRQLGADGNVRCLSTDSNLAGKNSQRIFREARCCARAEAFFRSRINYLIFCRIFEPIARGPP